MATAPSATAPTATAPTATAPMATAPTATAPSATAPTKITSTQMKAFICENSAILNHETKLAILQIISLEVGPEVLIEKSGPPPEVDVDLDAVAAANEEVISHIYNIVSARRAALSQPAGLAPPPEKK